MPFFRLIQIPLPGRRRLVLVASAQAGLPAGLHHLTWGPGNRHREVILSLGPQGHGIAYAIGWE